MKPSTLDDRFTSAEELRGIWANGRSSSLHGGSDGESAVKRNRVHGGGRLWEGSALEIKPSSDWINCDVHTYVIYMHTEQRFQVLKNALPTPSFP